MFLSGIPNPIIDSNTSKIREIRYGEQSSDSTNSTDTYNTNLLVPHSSSIPPEKNWEPEVVLGGPSLRLCWGAFIEGIWRSREPNPWGRYTEEQPKNASFELLSIGGGENGGTPQGREEASRKPRNEGLALQMDKLYQGTVLSPQICFNALACLFRVIKSDGLFSKTGCSPTTGTRLRWLTHAGGASSSSC